jgi:predicted dehydrogenase
MKIPTSHFISRRDFLYASGLAVASTTLSANKIVGANETVRLGFIGCGRRSVDLVRQFLKLPNVEVVAICDPDTALMDARMGTIEAALKETSASTPRVAKIQDYRKLLERQDIDAVIIPSTNYWHTLHAIHSVQAGKHVYVEKPSTFMHWEGPQLEAAAERYGKIIGVGYQNRSDPGPQSGIRYVQEGNLGKILKVRSLCLKNRTSIGISDSALRPPSTVDYDLWLGPAQEHTTYRPNLHYDWHWDYNTGNGDIGNQGPHETDMVYWLLGHPGLPTEVTSFGNRYAWDDGGNTPNMQATWCKWGDVDVILETNNVRLSPERNVARNRMGTRVGIIAECEKGYLKGGRFGMVALERDGKAIIKRFKGDGGREHQNSFIEAVRANNSSLFPIVPAQTHPSESVMHIGNASYRMGDLHSSSEIKSSFGNNQDLIQILEEQNEQLAAWGIKDPVYHHGPAIQIKPKTGEIITKGVPQELIGPHYRKGYEVPKLV